MLRVATTAALLAAATLAGSTANAGVTVSLGGGGYYGPSYARPIVRPIARPVPFCGTIPRPAVVVKPQVVYQKPIVVVKRKPIVYVERKPVVVVKPKPVVYKPAPVYKSVVNVSTATVVECCEPLHCYAWPCPGESLDEICEREYGDASLWPHVVEFNNLTGQLCVDTPVLLPNIHTDGRLTRSTAPTPPRPEVAVVQQAALSPPAAPPAAPL